MISYFVEIDAQGNLLELLRDDYTAIPPTATKISDADGLMLAASKFTDYQLVNGVVAINPNLTLELSRTEQLALMDTSYTAAVTAPIAYMGTTFQTDQASQDLIAGVLTAAGGALPAGFAWYDTNNAPVAMTFADLQGLAAAILGRGQPLFNHKQTQKAAIRAIQITATVTEAQAVAQVQGVVW